MNIKLNDVFRWRYSDKKLRELNHGNNGGTTYWCMSQIAVVELDWDELVYVDTYWYSQKTYLNKDKIASGDIILEYVGNLDEWERVSEDAYDYYNQEDIIDIRCSNKSNYGLYIRKGTQKSLKRIKEVLLQKIKDAEYHLKYANINLISAQKKLNEVTEENKNNVYL